MGERTGIAWCHHTFNPWIGCTRVSPGCDHCYAAVSRPAAALGIKWGAGEPRHRTSRHNWNLPHRWNKAVEIAAGKFALGQGPNPGRRFVFCSSLADVFDNEVPAAWRSELWSTVRATPYLTWLILSKRIGNAVKMMPHVDGPGGELQNVWLGASVVNQEEADRDIPKLIATPAVKRFVSYEPALGLIDWWPFLDASHNGRRLDWIIVGGESNQGGRNARPFDIAWARSTVEQCRAAGVACFVKQLGSNIVETIGQAQFTGRREQLSIKDNTASDPAEWPEDLRVQEFPA
ncbi:MAG TPA: DUF5131 family protein [Burkholderiales bacterium]